MTTSELSFKRALRVEASQFAGGTTSTLPFGLTVNDERARSFSFASSFVQVAKAAAEAKQHKFGGGPEQLAMLGIDGSDLIPAKQSDLDIWAEDHFTSFEDGPNSSEADGHFSVLYLGMDYVLSPHLFCRYNVPCCRPVPTNGQVSPHALVQAGRL